MIMAIKYQLISSNTTTTLDILPAEIVILIFSQHAICLKTLKTLMSVSRKMRHLGIYVLVHSRLPATILSVTIGQEGKSQVTTRFQFNHFCPITFNMLYTSSQPTARRYYTDKAYPVVHSMSIEVARLAQFSLASSSAILVGRYPSSIAKRPNLTAKLSDPASVYHCGNTKKLSAQKEGFHILQVPPYSANHRTFWKLAYRITNKHKAEYYLTPINVSIGFQHLLKLEALNSCNPNIEKTYSEKILNKLKDCVISIF